MKLRVPVLKPRNPLAVAARRRRAGPHPERKRRAVERDRRKIDSPDACP